MDNIFGVWPNTKPMVAISNNEQFSNL